MVADLLLIGLGITLEPFPLTAFILLLSAEKGTRKGLAFILGWLACLVVVIAAVVLVTGGKPPAPNTAPSADLAGHSPGPAGHRDLPAPGILAGRQEHLPHRRMTGDDARPEKS
jgi:hypothetical protein